MNINDRAGMPRKQRDVKYEETVRMLWGYAGRVDLVPGASRNGGRRMVWKYFKVQMDHSADKAYFSVRSLPSEAHCPSYCMDEPDSAMAEPGPDVRCECGVVHDGSGHDCEDSERGAGFVYNVRQG